MSQHPPIAHTPVLKWGDHLEIARTVWRLDPGSPDHLVTAGNAGVKVGAVADVGAAVLVYEVGYFAVEEGAEDLDEPSATRQPAYLLAALKPAE